MTRTSFALWGGLITALVNGCCGPTCDCVQDEPYEASVTFTSDSRQLNFLADELGVDAAELTCEQVCESQNAIFELESCDIQRFVDTDGSTSAELECRGINLSNCE
jgi:hypothetical protein